MNFQIGDVIFVDGGEYRVLGRITYQNVTDHCDWDEYRLKSETDGSEHWLSIDDTYKEYSIWIKAHQPDRTGYHEVDRGVEVVASCEGAVDVAHGDSANFVEYEDETEELLISDEFWEDEHECSTGYYLDEDEFWLIRSDPSFRVKTKIKGNIAVIIIILMIMIPMLSSVLQNLDFHITTTISKHLNRSSKYTYVTSVTGNEKQKAKIYKAPAEYTIDTAAKDIIFAIEGDTEYVQQDDTETDGAVAILTSKEYCVIYSSLEDGVLIQVSNRKYAYTTDDDLYHGTTRSRHYYRSFYYSTGYTKDSGSYSSYSSPYSSYSGDTLSYTGSDTYGSYSSSIRQSSIAARQSSGGGLSGGK